MAQNLYKTTDGIYVLADTIEIATDKYKTAKGKDAAGISLFQTSSFLVAATDNSNVTIPAVTGGTVYPNGFTAKVFPVGAAIQLNAVAADGYVFTQWEDGAGNVLSTFAQYEYTVQSDDITIKAIFTEIPRVLTTVPATNGTSYPDYSAGQNFNKGDVVQFNAVPDSGFSFTKWVDGTGATLGTSAKYDHTMDDTITVEAIFTAV